MSDAGKDPAVPFFDFLGIEHGRVEGQVGVAEMPWQPETANSSGRMHGGAVTAAVNAAMVRIVRELAGAPATLVQLAISFVSSGAEHVTATAEVVRSGRSIIFVTGRVVQSESGRVIATASAVFQRQPPAQKT
jgi:uncharacterized protein (TIGR00369 family)